MKIGLSSKSSPLIMSLSELKMRVIPDHISTADLMLNMEPEELGAKLLLLMRDRKKGAFQHLGMFELEDLQTELWERPEAERPGYSKEKSFFDVPMALREAWAWLEAQGFIVPDSQAAQAGFKRLSRRGRPMVDASSVASDAYSQRLPKESLHPKIADRVWASFVRGDYDGASKRRYDRCDGPLCPGCVNRR